MPDLQIGMKEVDKERQQKGVQDMPDTAAAKRGFGRRGIDLDQDIHSILELLLSFSEEIDTLKQDIQKLMQKK